MRSVPSTRDYRALLKLSNPTLGSASRPRQPFQRQADRQQRVAKNFLFTFFNRYVSQPGAETAGGDYQINKC